MCDARATQHIVGNCCRERPTGSALQLPAAGAPYRLETRMRTWESAVRIPVACDVCVFARGVVFVLGSARKGPVYLVTVDPRGRRDVINVCFGRICGRCFFRVCSSKVLVRWLEFWRGSAGHAFQQSLRSTYQTGTARHSWGALANGYCLLCLFVCLLVSLIDQCFFIDRKREGAWAWLPRLNAPSKTQDHGAPCRIQTHDPCLLSGC